MRCIIIEDQLPAQRIIQKYLKDLHSLNLIGSFQNAVDAFNFLKEHEVELIFLDINLPKISGISFLKNLTNPPQVIITSAYSQYALEGFELDVVDYLLKPFSFERFLKAVSKVKKTSDSNSETIFIKSDKEFFQVRISDITYIKGDDDFTRVHAKEKLYIDTRTMKAWMEELPSFFLRIHKSFIVNKRFISRIAGQRVFINKLDLPIGRTYKENVMKMVESK